jgi:exodeoxyribonuclease VII small subunit
MTKKDLSYNNALIELEKLIQEIESKQLDVDNLSTKVKRASELIRFCKDKLKKTEEEVENLLDEIDTEES